MNNEQINKNSISDEDMNEMITLLKKKRIRDEKIAKGLIKSNKWCDKTDEQKENHKLFNKKRNIKMKILANLAIDAKLISDKELEEQANLIMQDNMKL